MVMTVVLNLPTPPGQIAGPMCTRRDGTVQEMADKWDGSVAPFPRPFRLRLAYFVYQVLIHAALPLAVLKLWQLGRKEPLYRLNILHRFGLSRRKGSGAVWIFAASLGETRAASPLIRALLARGETILLTHSSAAGLQAGRELFGAEISTGRIVQLYQPIDALIPIWLFFWRWRPRVGLVMECELWPGLMFEAHRWRLPLVATNGSYTERANLRDRDRFWGLRLLLWPGFSFVTTKSKRHKERYQSTGIAPERIAVLGELKFDLPPNDAQVAAAAPARTALLRACGKRPIWMIASSIEGEEDALQSTIEWLHAKLNTPPLVLWVPRSPQRFGAIADRLAKAGMRVARRTQAIEGFEVTETDAIDVLVGDSIGEMDFYYAMADIVFVGATLYPMGGHNPIEPLALERPVVTGPSIYGVAFPAYEAIDHGALRAFDDHHELGAALIEYFSDAKKLKHFQARARGFNADHHGASDRTVAALGAVLRRPEGTV